MVSRVGTVSLTAMMAVRPMTPAPTKVATLAFLGAVYLANRPATAEVRMAVMSVASMMQKGSTVSGLSLIHI